MFGDSKVVIEWALENNCFFNLRLQPLLQAIHQSIRIFRLFLSRIYLELDVQADQLSKEALKPEPGMLSYLETVNGTVINGLAYQL